MSEEELKELLKELEWEYESFHSFSSKSSKKVLDYLRSKVQDNTKVNDKTREYIKNLKEIS